EYLYKTLELAWVENYSISFFEAVAENLIGVTRTDMPGDYLRERIDNLLSYLRPPNWAVLIELTRENTSWMQLCPSDVNMPSPTTTQFIFSGKWTKIIAEAGENRIVGMKVVLTLFKPEV
ncbi:MAG: hypothetical protein QMD95_03785, partial [Candidatus Hodarchaeaceae archaeon]|nr:hypothetical protein [Candidatus Hodarchaeaceae archaeon]